MTVINQLEYTREELVILALRNQYGDLSLTAAELGCTRANLQDYLINHPDVAQERTHIKESILDQMEALLVEKAKTSETLLMFYLRTQGKSRGYGNDHSKSGTTVNVNVNARTLIAAMRNGTHNASEIVEQSEDSDLLLQPRLFTVDSGS